MSTIKGIIKSYEANKFMSVIYTGGDISVADNENFFTCPSGDNINIIDYETGQQLTSLEGDSLVVSSCIHPKSLYLAMSCRSQNVFIYSMSKKTKFRSFRSSSPVVSMDYDPTGTLVAMGQGDHNIKIFDVSNNYITHHFKGHIGSVNFVKFHPKELKLVSVSMDIIKVWDLMTRECIATFTEHTSNITSVSFSPDGKYLLTGGQDQILNLYSVKDSQLVKTIPIFETIESFCWVPSTQGEYIIVLVTESGKMRKFNILTKEVLLEKETSEKHKSIQYMPVRGSLLAITQENNFEFLNLNFEHVKHILGFNDEVLDISYIGKKQNQAIVITNSEIISLYDLESKNTQLLTGHKDIALTVSSSSDSSFFATGSKDATIFIWEYAKLRRIAIGDSHSGPITSVCFAPNTKFLVSVSDDKTLKLWDLEPAKKNVKKFKSGDLEDKDIVPLVSKTVIAHTKDIGQVAVSVDSKLIATASGDRSCKIWDDELKMVHDFKHKAGVWCVAFSNVEKCVATGASDKMIRIWSLTTGVCLKVFEGHTKAILQVAFVNVGQQLLTSSADGIVKLWGIKTNECVATFDEHKDRVWAIDVKQDGKEFISGGEDSIINIWKDNTEVVVDEEHKESDEAVLQDQEISNLVRNKKTLEAIRLAIKRNRPKIIYELITTVENIDSVVEILDSDEITQLLQYSIDWNTNTKFSIVAQKILYSLFKTCDPSIISFSYEKSVESLLAYSNRHMKRVEGLLEQSYFMDYMLANMNMGIETKIVAQDEKMDYGTKTKFIPQEDESSKRVHDAMTGSLENPKKKKKHE